MSDTADLYRRGHQGVVDHTQGARLVSATRAPGEHPESYAPISAAKASRSVSRARDAGLEDTIPLPRYRPERLV